MWKWDDEVGQSESVLPIMGEGILMEPMKELVKHGQAPNWVRVGQGIKCSIY